MDHIFFIHSCVSRYLGCSHVLAVVKSAAVNIAVHVSFLIMFFCRCMPRSGIVGSYGSSVFSFLRKLCVGNPGLIPGLGRSPEGGMATHSSILAWRIPLDRGAWRATVHGVTKSQTRPSDRARHSPEQGASVLSPWWRFQLTFPPAGPEGSLLSTPSPASVGGGFFGDSHSDS